MRPRTAAALLPHEKKEEKKNKPPLIHVFLPWRGTPRLSQDQDECPAPSFLYRFLYTKLLRLRLVEIKDAGFEIEESSPRIRSTGRLRCNAMRIVRSDLNKYSEVDCKLWSYG